jgi:PAS domain S-box-containing protein
VLGRLEQLLLPESADLVDLTRGDVRGQRYARMAVAIAVGAVLGFGPTLLLKHVPSELWLPYFGGVVATAVLAIATLLIPRPGSWAGAAAALAVALAMAALDAEVAPYYPLGPLVFPVVVVVVAIVQGVRAALGMILAGTILLPVLMARGSQPQPDDYLYTFLFLFALAAAVWAFRQLQARSAAAVEASEARYRALVERIPGVVYECETGLEGVWTYVSPRVEQVLGFAPERFTGDPGFWWSRIHPDDRSRTAANEAELEAHAGMERSVSEYRMIDVAGSVRWISDEASLVRDHPSGRPIWSGILIDVTAEKELEQRLRRAERMEAVGRLAGGIAHDFNNLLTVIHGYADLVRTSVAARGDETVEVDELIEAADRATSLTRQLLTFGRREVLQPQVLDPAMVVADLTPMLKRLLGDQISLVVTGPAVPVRVRIDRSQLEQVVLNLAINARDAMPDGGRLAVAVERVETIPRGATAPTVTARISVLDSGAGMDDEVRSQIFEPFFTTKSAGGGTGLGLSTVLGIVTQAGGQIDCDSAPGRGTTFRIELPAVDGPESPADAGDEAESPGGQGRVLLVEDQEPVRVVTARMLMSLGYEVVEAPGGVEALMALAREPSLVLLITDVSMPGMLGTELAQRAIQQRPQLPVLLITGYAGEGRAAVDEGPFSVLAKPFDVGALARAARAAIDAPPVSAFAPSPTSAPKGA